MLILGGLQYDIFASPEVNYVVTQKLQMCNDARTHLGKGKGSLDHRAMTKIFSIVGVGHLIYEKKANDEVNDWFEIPSVLLILKCMKTCISSSSKSKHT